MLLVGPAIDGKVYESDLINDGWNRTLWLSTLYHPPKSFWLLRNFICVRNLTLMLYENDARSIHLFVIIFLIKKKCTHLRSAITKANFEFLFQHRHFFIAWLWWWYYYILEGKWQNISNQDFFKKKSIYIFLSFNLHTFYFFTLQPKVREKRQLLSCKLLTALTAVTSCWQFWQLLPAVPAVPAVNSFNSFDTGFKLLDALHSSDSCYLLSTALTAYANGR